MSQDMKLTTNAGAPVVENLNSMTAGPCGSALLKDVRLLEKLDNQPYNPWLAVQFQT